MSVPQFRTDFGFVSGSELPRQLRKVHVALNSVSLVRGIFSGPPLD